MSTCGIRSGDEPRITVVMPCLNEAATVCRCTALARRVIEECGSSGEVIVADNGSSDDSVGLAASAGARVVRVPRRGYGAAIIGGIAAARGEFVVMGDADGTYDFAQIPAFVCRLNDGYDLVVGNRFWGGIEPGAMPPLHLYLGNPVLTGIGRLLFHSPCGDFHCGLRAFRRDAIRSLRLESAGMELASEMIVKAMIAGLRVSEVPVRLSRGPDGRVPHLRAWRDGLRHLRVLIGCKLADRRRPITPPLRLGFARAFSIVEMLVVIGIISLLVAIIMPMVVSARRESERAVCLSNLRQLETAFASYATANRNQGPPYARHGDGVWAEALRRDYGGKDEIRFCPAAQYKISSEWGGARTAWTFDLRPAPDPINISGSYGLNGWLMRWDPNGQGGSVYSGGKPGSYVSGVAASATIIPVFGDCTWIDAWPREDDPTPPDLLYGDQGRQGNHAIPHENMMARFTIARHGRRTNIAFLDGHAESVDLDGLKRLKWHQGFKYQSWSPPLPLK